MEQQKQTILVTGGAGFIGSNLVDHLLKQGNYRVIALDNFDPYYPRAIKEENLSAAKQSPDFELIEMDVTNGEKLQKLPQSIDAIVHLAAKAGVRPSIENPIDYLTTNIIGTANLLEFAKLRKIRQFVYASSSSVYGEHPSKPWDENLVGLKPISQYALSKLAAEELGYLYTLQADIRFVSLRLFSVYGRRQRPDLAITKFVKLLRSGKEIEVYGDGSSARDYTYIDDVLQCIIRAINYRKTQHEILNIGSGVPIALMDLISTLSKALDVTPKISLKSTQMGDVSSTWATTERTNSLLGLQIRKSFKDGIAEFLKLQKF
jgi:UDP-glucuronate 4-epimerase